MNLPEIGTAVIVVWFDSTTTSGWAGRATSPSVRKILTLGWLIGASPVAIEIASTMSDSYSDNSPATSNHLDALTIPLGCIYKVKEVVT